MLANLTWFLPFLGLTSVSFAVEQKVLQKDQAGPFSEKFAQLVNETLSLWHVPGISVAVIDGENVWAQGYGIASFPDEPVTASTLFYGGSTTKAFTAAAMSLLVDDDENYPQVQWNTPVSELIRDDFVLENDYATTHITIEDILSHRTGLPRHDFSYGGTHNGHRATLRDAVRDIRYLPLTAEPRTRYQYCNLMFMVAAHVIETLADTWLGDFLLEHIWKPLDMKSTYFSTPAALKAPEFLAQGYVYYKSEYVAVPFMDLSIVSGAGSVISNVLDYTKWLKALINGSGPISKNGYKALTASRTVIPANERPSAFTGPETYSLGWHTSVYRGYEFFDHSGGMEAFGAEVIFFPALKYGLVSFGNTAVTSNAAEERLLWHLVDEKLGIPEKDRFDWNMKNQNAIRQLAESYDNASGKYYPTRPNPPIVPSLPLQNYTGTYRHPAYHNMTLSIKSGQLYVNRSDAVWKMAVELEHISGDYFMAHVDSTTAPGLIFREAIPAEFIIGSDGVSRSFGIMAEPEMGPEERIWFDRI